jgi:hypothetical protein
MVWDGDDCILSQESGWLPLQASLLDPAWADKYGPTVFRHSKLSGNSRSVHAVMADGHVQPLQDIKGLNETNFTFP